MWSILIEAIAEIGKAIAAAYEDRNADSAAIKASCEAALIKLRTAGKASCAADENNATVDAERHASASGAESPIVVDLAALRKQVGEIVEEFKRAFVPASSPK